MQNLVLKQPLEDLAEVQAEKLQILHASPLFCELCMAHLFWKKSELTGTGQPLFFQIFFKNMMKTWQNLRIFREICGLKKRLRLTLIWKNYFYCFEQPVLISTMMLRKIVYFSKTLKRNSWQWKDMKQIYTYITGKNAEQLAKASMIIGKMPYKIVTE